MLLPQWLIALALVAPQGAGPRDPNASAAASGPRGANVPSFWVRPGYRVTLVAEGVDNARFLEQDDKGNFYVSRPDKGDILVLRTESESLKQVATFVTGRNRVHGMQWKDGWLWYSTSGSIRKARDSDGDGRANDDVAVIPDGQLPTGGGHWWRSILVTEESIYTSIGETNNASDESNSERQKIWRFNREGKDKRLWCSGIRNTEKLRLRPGTSEIWGFDHGSDWFGGPLGEQEGKQPITEINPPDEFNRYVEGGFYGHPFLVGNNIPRYEFSRKSDILDLAEKAIPPAWPIQAHYATNGFTFLVKSYFGADHTGDAVVACHGSWNRKVPAGYSIERVLFDKVLGTPYGQLKLVSCITTEGKVLARPVDVLELGDGSLLFSCDETGRIYRISRLAR